VKFGYEIGVSFDTEFFLRILYLKDLITVKGCDVLGHPPDVLTQILSVIYVTH